MVCVPLSLVIVEYAFNIIAPLKVLLPDEK